MVCPSFAITPLALFGGKLPWDASDWTSLDDTLRGGLSQSSLDVALDHRTAMFKGNLDIKKLDGAGFASQTTTAEDRIWDLHQLDGITVAYNYAGNRPFNFTLSLRMQLPNIKPKKNRRSTLEYDYTFTASPEVFTDQYLPHRKPKTLYVPFEKFEPTYRGRHWPKAKSLDPRKIRRFSVMARAFHGKQSGEFSLELVSITATVDPDRPRYHTMFMDEGKLAEICV